MTPETLRGHINDLLTKIDSKAMQRRTQFTPNEKALVTWVLNNHGVDLLGEAVEKAEQYMFGGLALRIRIFVLAGRTAKCMVDNSTLDFEYAERSIYDLLGDTAKHVKRPNVHSTPETSRK